MNIMKNCVICLQINTDIIIIKLVISVKMGIKVNITKPIGGEIGSLAHLEWAPQAC